MKISVKFSNFKISSENCYAIKDDGEIQLKRERYTTTKVPG